MRGRCEHCDAPVTLEGEAFVHSYECTFCPICTAKMKRVCPNCGGEFAFKE